MDINEHDIRTAFDSEGTISPAKHRRGIWWRLNIYNNDLRWLELLQEYLIQQGYHIKIDTIIITYKQKPRTTYCLRIYRIAEIERFLTEFPPLMAQKQKRAAEFRQWRKRPHLVSRLGRSQSTVKAVEQMLKNSRRMI